MDVDYNELIRKLFCGGNTDLLIEHLKNKKLSPNHICSEGIKWSILMCASSDGYLELVKILVKTADIDINYTDNIGWNALLCHVGSVNININICKELINAGINVNNITHFGSTSLSFVLHKYYIYTCSKEVIILLLESGVWPFYKHEESIYSDFDKLKEIDDPEFLTKCRFIIAKNIVKEGVIPLPCDIIHVLIDYL